MKSKKIFFLLFGISLFSQMIFSQIVIKRDPDFRKDYANVFYKPQYTLFDLWSDEPIFPDGNKIYHIYYASNEDKTPKEFNGTGYQLSGYQVYKFKNYENCKNWCDGVTYKVNSSKYTISSSQTKPSEVKKVPEDPSFDAIQITALANSKKTSIDESKLKPNEKCIEGNCIDSGTILYSNGDTFKGKFSGLGVKSDGEYKWVNGDSYIGRFNKGNFEYGELNFGGKTYTGSFLNNKYNGIGTLFSNDFKYEGGFKEGEFNGYGELYVNMYDITLKGEWKGKHMVGKVYSKEGVSSTIIWDNGKFKSVNNSNQDNINSELALALINSIFSGDSSSSSSSSQYNAYQCSGCAFISKGTREPNRSDFNGCVVVNHSKTSHLWHKINTNGKGQQCSKCGIKYYGPTTLVSYSFGGCSDGGQHYWREF
jgi:hypothetical protein